MYRLLLCLLLALCHFGHAATLFYLDAQTSLGSPDFGDPLCQVASNSVCGRLYGFKREDINDPITAINALTIPPSPAQAGRLVLSGLPRGTRVLGMRTESDTTIVDLSPEVIGKGLDEVRLTSIFNQVRATLWQFGATGSVRVEANGKLLSDYLPPVKSVRTATVARLEGPVLNSLATRKIALSPGHGYFWNGSGWFTQRPVYCAPLNQEDFHTLEMMQYLNTYLTADGATTKPYRCLDKNFGNHSSGRPWWQMASYLWVQQLGFPCSIYASSTGDCTTGTGGTELNDDIRARPLAADADGVDIYVSLHSNGFTGDCTGSCPTGTETYYDSTSPQPAGSQTLANNINSSIMSAITANVDPSWTCHGTCVKNSNGSFGEIRIPDCPATLTELGFHDTCDRDGDANHLRDNFFRSAAMWGMYKGICAYFGTTPAWAFYSNEIISNDIPATMTPGSVATVHITVRNRGVLWNDARQFRLGAVNDSDPFTATTRFNVGSEIGPGATKTFTFNLSAPVVPGSYTTDWQMLREGVTWFGPVLTKSITVSGVAGGPSITLQPKNQSVSQGATATFNVVAAGNPPLSYQWRKNSLNLTNSVGKISGANTATLTINNVQPADAGNYSVLVANTNGSILSDEAALNLTSGTSLGAYTLDSGNMDSTSRSASYVAFTACGANAWYSFGVPGPAGSNCTVFNRDIRWVPPLPTYGISGRAFLTASALIPNTHAAATANFFALDSNGSDLPGPISGSVNECAFSCSWVTFYNGPVNISSFGGWRSNTQNDGPPGGGGCNLACGTFAAGYSQLRVQAARWQYVNDWVCLGGYGSTNVSDTANRAFAFGEAGLYLFPALDTTHGNTIAGSLGLAGKSPGRVTTGDCNNTNTLDFKGNANAFGGGDQMDAYAFAWVFSPTGASPQVVIGSDDGNRLWVNGTLRNSTNASRGLIRDQDNTGPVTLPVGWSRLLFKVHNFTGAFQGTVSLRNSTDSNLNEPGVNVFDSGGYYSYGVGYEQDSWFPLVYVTNFYGASNPQPNNNYYGNDTTIVAMGTAAAGGPVPFWKVMHYEWGYGPGVDTDYTNVSSNGAAWSHTASGVTGHRRFHFFAVSQSGRTSFQDSGKTGGSNWTGLGAATYLDVYVDNQPPQNPLFAGVTVIGTNEVQLNWATPLDEGVGIGPGATEAADEGSNVSGNYYRAGDVAVQLRRNGLPVGDWFSGTNSSVNDSGLIPNSAYTYTLEARDNNSSSRGNWHNMTGAQASTNVWTLSLPPGPNSVTASQTQPSVGSNVTWTAVNGFGPGTVQYYRHAWDQSATHTWNDSETQWASSTLSTLPTSPGAWFLHVKGYNGDGVANGTYDYAVNALETSGLVATIEVTNQTATITWPSVPGKTYRLQYKSHLSDTNWNDLSPDVTASSAMASKSEPLTDLERFYRVMRVD